MPKIPTVTGKLDGGKRPARKPGHQPTPLTSTMAPKTTYSRTKTVRKTRRKLEIRRACHIAPARTNPVMESPTRSGEPRELADREGYGGKHRGEDRKDPQPVLFRDQEGLRSRRAPAGFGL